MMKSYVTSFNGLFARRGEGLAPVYRIEIPLIQRDYAQGRIGESVARIRADFLNVLHGAVTTGRSLGLDFVYGDVKEGTFRPLDGQQRLTTLFLLHWYLAWRATRLDQEHGWKRFSYATRPSARRFCEVLVNASPPNGTSPRAWLEDQFWFQFTWKHDPTIQSMLTMLEAIHERFAGTDYRAAWERLVDREQPAICFHVLPIEQLGPSGDDLFIKMNSRGKPLTPFEQFKARFEQLLSESCPSRVEEVARKVDGVWADILWRYRGADDIVDDEFMRYFHFATELCAWNGGESPSTNIEALAEIIYGRENANREANLDFLFRALDTWVGADPAALFSLWFTRTTPTPASGDVSKVALFSPLGAETTNLFFECCRGYGDLRGKNRVFSWPQTLLLYAVLLHRIHGTPEFGRRLRVLRNLIEASSSELRLDRMPALLGDVRRIIIEGDLDGVGSFNQAQVADEKLKDEMLARHPALAPSLFLLEDHQILRGGIFAFEMDPSVVERRARAFHEAFNDPALWPALTGALLAAGNYGRVSDSRVVRFGSGSNRAPWRDLLTGATRAALGATREALGQVLDIVAARTGDVRSALGIFTEQWLEKASAEGALDWRWYFVKYAAMREGPSGRYACPNGTLGYDVCMLDKDTINSFYRDPFLHAVKRESGVQDAAVQGAVGHHWPDGPWFTGYETEPRWMRLVASGTEIRCVAEGFQLRPPSAPPAEAGFVRVCEAHGLGRDCLLRIPQVSVGTRLCDTQDRIQRGARLLRDLVNAGL